jgi:hypothetical protein
MLFFFLKNHYFVFFITIAPLGHSRNDPPPTLKKEVTAVQKSRGGKIVSDNSKCVGTGVTIL